MIGAGVFAAFAPAAAAAGSGLLIGLLLAGLVALCNATSSAQLAAHYPTSGGTYVYGREELGHWWGYLAGWCFVIGKSASCAAMAMTFAAHVIPDGWLGVDAELWRKALGIAAVLTLTAVNYHGVTRTARLAGIVVTLVLAVLAVVVVLGVAAPGAGPLFDSGLPSGALGVLQSGGLLFFAFAGYARIATLGEEVVEPRRTIPRAILIALAVAFVVYLLVGVAALRVLGSGGLAASRAPLVDVVRSVGAQWAVPLVRVGAAVAALGSLLSLIAGIGRTSLAMGREGDLPRWLAAVHPKHKVPHHAEIAVGVAVSVLVALVDLRGAIGFSSFGVLLYYFVANASALHQTQGRRYPRALQVIGMALCLLLAFSLPLVSVIAGVILVALGLVVRVAVRVVVRAGQRS